MSMWHQLEFEGCVDVFQLARLYHYSRPGIWRSQVYTVKIVHGNSSWPGSTTTAGPASGVHRYTL
jgi:hypothetical protein